MNFFYAAWPARVNYWTKNLSRERKNRVEGIWSSSPAQRRSEILAGQGGGHEKTTQQLA
jgi:hypothetical protein